MNLIINIIGFQFGWFAAVLGGANQLAWLGTAAALIIVAIHLFRSPGPGKEARLIMVAALIGLAWESALVSLDIMSYPSGTLVPGLAPHWIVAMWMLFATTLNVSFRWLRHRARLSAVLGAAFGPLAFYAGHRLGGVEFSQTALAMVVLATGWALFMPLLLWLGQYLDGTRSESISSKVQHV